MPTVIESNPIYLTNCDTDVTYPGGPRWLSRTVRMDQQQNRPLAHWKRGLDVDQWVLVLEPRNVDPVTQEPYPDKIGDIPWIAAARAGALDGCEIEVLRAFWYKWPDYAPVITPTGIISIFVGRVAEVDVTDALVVITINDMRELLTRMVPSDVYSAQCRHTLFDYGCTLVKSSFAEHAICDYTSTTTAVVAKADVPIGAGLTYAQGRLEMTGGLNNGFARSIATWSSNRVFNLRTPLPFDVAPGDSFTVYPGCDKTRATCTAYGNIANFGGFPYIPTVQAAI
jgi:uncharacterized phage protein (TIGR02218 family)